MEKYLSNYVNKVKCKKVKDMLLRQIGYLRVEHQEELRSNGYQEIVKRLEEIPSFKIFLLQARVGKFELRMRRLLKEQLVKSYGETDYLKKGVPENILLDINKGVEGTKIREPNIEITNPFNFCDILQYHKIIKYNWEDIFKSIFKFKKELKSQMENISYLPEFSLILITT